MDVPHVWGHNSENVWTTSFSHCMRGNQHCNNLKSRLGSPPVSLIPNQLQKYNIRDKRQNTRTFVSGQRNDYHPQPWQERRAVHLAQSSSQSEQGTCQIFCGSGRQNQDNERWSFLHSGNDQCPLLVMASVGTTTYSGVLNRRQVTFIRHTHFMRPNTFPKK